MLFSKVEYERNLKIYHNSPAYQQYMQAKARGTPVVEEPQVSQDFSKNGFVLTDLFWQDPMPVAQGRSGKNAERRIDIQPAEDEEVRRDFFTIRKDLF